jgi:hypothetical protein
MGNGLKGLADYVPELGDRVKADYLCDTLYSAGPNGPMLLCWRMNPGLEDMKSLAGRFNEMFGPFHDWSPRKLVKLKDKLSIAGVVETRKDKPHSIYASLKEGELPDFASWLASYNISRANRYERSLMLGNCSYKDLMILSFLADNNSTGAAKQDIVKHIHERTGVTPESYSSVFVVDSNRLIDAGLVSREDRGLYRINEGNERFVTDCYGRIWGDESFDPNVLGEMESIYDGYMGDHGLFAAEARMAIDRKWDTGEKAEK